MRQYRIKYVCTLYDILVLCFILWWISSSFIFNSRVISNEQLIYSYTLSVVYVATRIFRSSISVQRRLYMYCIFGKHRGHYRLGTILEHHRIQSSSFLNYGNLYQPRTLRCFSWNRLIDTDSFCMA